MTRVRIGLLAAAICLAASGAIIPTAVAAPGQHGSANTTSVPPQYTVHLNGVSHNGKRFSGTYGIQRFVVATVNGRRGVYALGTLTGRLDGRHVSRNNVLVPASLTGANGTRSTRQAGATCTILHLVLGPIDLNLLGLRITTNQIVINVTAQQGGGLLGDLLCGLDNALGGGTTLQQLTNQLNALSGVLNSILGLLGGGAPTLP